MADLFADVILPLPLYSSFTYSVPDYMQPDIQTGSRVLVQFGRKKFYTAIVEKVHTVKPEYEVKPIMAVMDPQPVVRYPQLNFWRWIADYYLCSPGEVYKAAVPTGLKPESETFVSLNADYEPSDTPVKLTERQELVVAVLMEKKREKISELENYTKIKSIPSVIAPLLEAGIIEIDEHVVERYRPRTVRCVRLNVSRNEKEKLHEFFGMVTRSRAQERALVAYLDLSRWMQPNKEPEDVERDALMKASGASPGVLRAMADKGIFTFYKKSVNRFASVSKSEGTPLPSLSESQREVSGAIDRLWREKNTVLLHGVTGSGKTEIYIRLMDSVLRNGSQVLYLVPEISLTTQLTDRIRKVFGDRLLVYHSKFSDSERVDIWKRMLSSKEPIIVLGARSAVFLPFARLGLVVVDEEHESSYKQYDPAPRYNARDAALLLASMHGAKSLLGSATPSVETYYKALNGKYGLVTLSERFEGASLPDVEIIDMKEMRKKKEVSGILSAPLAKATMEVLKGGKQAIMFQNRRGFAPVVVCNQCGWVPKCNNCDVSMVYHRHSGLLRCHYCGYSVPLPPVCPACGGNSLEVYGYGTERIADELHERFEGYRVARMDLDTTRNKDAYQEIIDEFARHETDILVGTQMVTKGLDFANVNLVGVLNADTLLNFPDFRSNERAFNMLEQVAGRAGRRQDKGKVIIQTTNPKEPVLAFVKAHDYKGYYESEIADRRKFAYPPFTRVINVYLKNKDSATADAAAVTLALALRQVFGERVLGPEKPFVSRVATWYLQSIMLKVEAQASMPKVKAAIRAVYESIAADPRIKSSIIYYDVDPA